MFSVTAAAPALFVVESAVDAKSSVTKDTNSRVPQVYATRDRHTAARSLCRGRTLYSSGQPRTQWRI